MESVQLRTVGSASGRLLFSLEDAPPNPDVNIPDTSVALSFLSKIHLLLGGQKNEGARCPEAESCLEK